MLDDYVNVTLCILLTLVPTQRSVFMRALRLTVPAILFAVILVGCIVQADTFSDQNPFSAPDTLQSSGDGSVEGSTVNPNPVGILTSTPTPEPTATPVLPTATPQSALLAVPAALQDKELPTPSPDFYPDHGK